MNCPKCNAILREVEPDAMGVLYGACKFCGEEWIVPKWLEGKPITMHEFKQIQREWNGK